ncbi:MAG: hypothetical protein ACOCUU_03160 [Nanoarchaeota archaeon]
MGPKEIKDKDRKLEVQKETARSFREYFGSEEVICDNISELNKKVDDFFEWRNKEWIVPGKGKTPEQLWKEKGRKKVELSKSKFEEIFSEDMARFGLLFRENNGMLIVPFYDYLKKLFEGNYKEIPDYHGFIYNIVVETDKFVPSFVLKEFISKNPKRTLDLFKNLYKEVESMEDVNKILKNYRSDWDKDIDLNTELYDFDDNNGKE